MKNHLELVAKGKKPYSKPMIEVINLEGESIICTSGETMTVADPFGGGVSEIDW